LLLDPSPLFLLLPLFFLDPSLFPELDTELTAPPNIFVDPDISAIVDN
jgi:hypothetical protein